jgi:hypothetical protein
MTRALLALAILAAIAAAVALSTPPTTRHAAPAQPRRTLTPEPTRTPAPPELPVRAINGQDRTSAGHRAREARAFDSRRLLARLPLQRAGVRIDLAGLAPDEHTTILSIDPGGRSRAHAQAVYARELARAGDPASAYALEWTR